MRIVVISLKSSQQRRDSIRRQFAALNMPFEFFNAITAGEAPQHIHHYDEQEFQRNTGRTASLNEIACYASHLALWKFCANNNEPILIVEDDARLSKQFVEGFVSIERAIHERGFIRAAMPVVKHSFPVERLGNFRLRYCRKVPLQSLAYAVSPAVAARFVAVGSIVEEPVDKFIQRFWRHRQAIFALRPFIVHLDPIGNTSGIGVRTRECYTLRSWTKRAARKSANTILREWFNWRMFFVLRSATRTSDARNTVESDSCSALHARHSAPAHRDAAP